MLKPYFKLVCVFVCLCVLKSNLIFHKNVKKGHTSFAAMKNLAEGLHLNELLTVMVEICIYLVGKRLSTVSLKDGYLFTIKNISKG
jgi:hypothetical protein